MAVLGITVRLEWPIEKQAADQSFVTLMQAGEKRGSHPAMYENARVRQTIGLPASPWYVACA
jgi:hypothetical protein